MVTVMGIDKDYNARIIEVEGDKDEVRAILLDQGWTGLMFLDK